MTTPDKVVLSSTAEITQALSDQRLVPPSADASGATMILRADMARFSAPTDHGKRRTDVEATIVDIDLATASNLAARVDRSW